MNLMVRNHKNNRGFTLNELLITVSIIVIIGLALLIGLNPMAQLFKGYDARRKDDLHKIKIALENYYADHDCYPLFPIKDSKNRPSYVCGSDMLQPYLSSMPCDPNTKTPYVIYLYPSDSICPQQFAVYAQIYSFFDKNANLIPFCPKTIAVGSSGMAYAQMSAGCASVQICPNHYGCQAGACTWLSGYEVPACTPNYCTNTCGQLDAASAAVYCQKVNNTCR